MWAWALAKKLWRLGVAVFLLFIGLSAVGALDAVTLPNGGLVQNFLVPAVEIAIGVIFGINGNAWREKTLISQGFHSIDVVSAASPQGAIALHLDSTTFMKTCPYCLELIKAEATICRFCQKELVESIPP
jgi:hypothetical protein